VRSAGDERVGGKARIGGGILDHQHVAQLHRVAAEGHRTRGFRHVQAAARLEPLAVLVDQRHQRDRDPEGHRGQARKTVDPLFRRRVEDAEGFERDEAGVFGRGERIGHGHSSNPDGKRREAAGSKFSEDAAPGTRAAEVLMLPCMQHGN
jgi:hypothetical protein